MNTRRFENALAEALEKALGRSGAPSNLAESIRYSLLGPGKRIRPRLALASSALVGLPDDAAFSTAIALEMIHCFTLIHDDLPCMDDDDFRRGRPSNHKKFGEAVALLAGDALMAMAVESFSESLTQVQARHFCHGFSRFCWAMGPRGVIGGQAAEFLLDEHSTLEDLRKMHAGKTGALFSASVLIPADLAGIPADSAQFKALEQFASDLGLAFQVADDLDVEEQDKGKPLSILYFMTPDKARQDTRTRLQNACEELKSAWGERTEGLLSIAKQVQKSLGRE